MMLFVVGGQFPEDLRDLFPWETFFLGTQRDYLMKEASWSAAFRQLGEWPHPCSLQNQGIGCRSSWSRGQISFPWSDGGARVTWQKDWWIRFESVWNLGIYQHSFLDKRTDDYPSSFGVPYFQTNLVVAWNQQFLVLRFLWLSPAVKNAKYKAPVHDWLERFEYPFRSGAAWHGDGMAMGVCSRPWISSSVAQGLRGWGVKRRNLMMWKFCWKFQSFNAWTVSSEEKVGFNAMHNVQWQEDCQISSFLAFTTWIQGFSLGNTLKGKRIASELNMLALVEDKSVVYTSFAKPDPKAGLFCLSSKCIEEESISQVFW